jgi:hypothetical protein
MLNVLAQRMDEKIDSLPTFATIILSIMQTRWLPLAGSQSTPSGLDSAGSVACSSRLGTKEWAMLQAIFKKAWICLLGNFLFRDPKTSIKNSNLNQTWRR